MRLGQPIDLHLSLRYYAFNRGFAIRDAFDALVELITNCDDSYHRLFKKGLRDEDGGPILIQYLEQRKGRPSCLFVHDRAEGMTLHEMENKLGDVGTKRSETGDRGFMARGLRDCTELGRIVIESIKSDAYFKCELTPQAQFIPWEDFGKVTKDIRSHLRIPHGNGTVIALEIDPKRRTPRFDSIRRDLAWHFALRDILSEHSPTKVMIRNLNKPNERAERIVWRHPDGVLVCDESFIVPGYRDATANLRIWRAAEPFEDTGSRFRRYGIIIKGERAVHECSLLAPEFDKDLYARRYFGRLECTHIDKLLRDFDETREKGEPSPDDNPCLLIDPNRQYGLIREHPFTKVLLLLPSERLRARIAKDREAERSRHQQIANEETQRRLDRLARRASFFFKQQLDDIQELTKGEAIDKSAFSKDGVLIFPTYLNVVLGEERTLTYYAKTSLLADDGEKRVVVEADDPALSVLDTPIELRPHKVKDDRLVGIFRVRGSALKDGVIIRAVCGCLPTAQAIAAVVEKSIDEHIFDQPLEFEYERYTVREGSRRSLELFAQYPEVVAQPTMATIATSNPAGVSIRGTCQLSPVTGSNYALGSVIVQGRRIGARSGIEALVNGRRATTQVTVIDKPQEPGIPFKIELSDEDFGSFRAMWADREGKPHLLKISARHKSLSRYLGPSPDYEGQDAPHFRVLLAEIVAEAVCRKALSLESKERTWEFRWADLKEDTLIVDDVLAKLQQRVRSFVADAHSIMLSDTELRRTRSASP